MTEKINILVATRHEEDILPALANDSDFAVISVEKNETDAIIKTERLKPDVLVFNLKMAGVTELDIVRIVRRRSPLTAIIFIEDDGESESENASLLLKTGASAFLTKTEDINKLTHIVKLAYSGGKYVSASLINKFVNEVSLKNQLPGQFMEINSKFYTPTERCIITELANGYSDDEIAINLNLSKGSIRNCITGIRRKTKMKSRIEIVIFSLLFGLIRLESLRLWNEKGGFVFQENTRNKEKSTKKN